MVDDFLNSDAFRGAYAGAKITLEQLGIEMSDAILIFVASNVLKGFVTMGCLEPGCLKTLRAIVTADIEPGTRN